MAPLVAAHVVFIMCGSRKWLRGSPLKEAERWPTGCWFAGSVRSLLEISAASRPRPPPPPPPPPRSPPPCRPPQPGPPSCRRRARCPPRPAGTSPSTSRTTRTSRSGSSTASCRCWWTSTLSGAVPVRSSARGWRRPSPNRKAASPWRRSTSTTTPTWPSSTGCPPSPRCSPCAAATSSTTSWESKTTTSWTHLSAKSSDNKVAAAMAAAMTVHRPPLSGARFIKQIKKQQTVRRAARPPPALLLLPPYCDGSVNLHTPSTAKAFLFLSFFLFCCKRLYEGNKGVDRFNFKKLNEVCDGVNCSSSVCPPEGGVVPPSNHTVIFFFFFPPFCLNTVREDHRSVCVCLNCVYQEKDQVK